MKKLIFIILGSFLLSSSSFAQSSEAIDGKVIITKKCVECHNVKEICSEIGEKKQAFWTETVADMVKKGAKLNESEQKDVISYLSKLKDKKKLCK